MAASLRRITISSIPRSCHFPNASSALPASAPGPHIVLDVVVVYSEGSDDFSEPKSKEEVLNEVKDEELRTAERSARRSIAITTLPSRCWTYQCVTLCSCALAKRWSRTAVAMAMGIKHAQILVFSS